MYELLLSVALFAGTPAAAAPTQPASSESPCPQHEDKTPVENLVDCLGTDDLQRLAASFERELGLAHEVAESLAAAVPLWQKLQASSREDRKNEVDSLRGIETRLIEAARAASGPLLLGELKRFYETFGWDLRLPSEALLALVDEAPDPAAFVWDLTGEGEDLPFAQQLLTRALRHAPDDPILWVAISSKRGTTAWQLALLDRAASLLEETAEGSPEARLGVAVATLRLATLAEFGLESELLRTYRQLPEAYRRAIGGGLEGEFGTTLSGRSIRLQLPELRLDLAVAAWLVGDKEEARRFFSLVLEPDATIATGGHVRPPARLRWEFMARVLGSSSEDPFELLSQLAHDRHDQVLSRVLWRRAIAHLAFAEGYPGFARHQLAPAVWRLRWVGEEPSPEIGVDESLLSARVAELAERAKSLAGTVKAELDLAEGQIATRGGGGLPPHGRDREQHPESAWSEKPLPAGIEPLELSEEARRAHWSELWAAFRLPKGFIPKRIEQQGNEVLAVASSQDLDPTGETSGGGYWILRSTDSGASWGPALYTGLQVHRPYVVREVSSLPPTDGDRVLLEVELQEIDLKSVIFPPVGLKLSRQEKGLYLEIPWSTLERDRDRDGLTDLVEAAMLTDPEASDTDADGIPDAEDAIPRVPLAPSGSPEELAFAAALGAVDSAILPAILEAPGSGESPQARCCLNRPGISRLEVRFLEGPTSLLRGVTSERRIGALSADEARLLREQKGLFYPARIELFALDRENRRGILIWSESWRGGTILLEEHERHWETEVTSQWIT